MSRYNNAPPTTITAAIIMIIIIVEFWSSASSGVDAADVRDESTAIAKTVSGSPVAVSPKYMASFIDASTLFAASLMTAPVLSITAMVYPDAILKLLIKLCTVKALNSVTVLESKSILVSMFRIPIFCPSGG